MNEWLLAFIYLIGIAAGIVILFVLFATIEHVAGDGSVLLVLTILGILFVALCAIKQTIHDHRNPKSPEQAEEPIQ